MVNVINRVNNGIVTVKTDTVVNNVACSTRQSFQCCVEESR